MNIIAEVLLAESDFTVVVLSYNSSINENRLFKVLTSRMAHSRELSVGWSFAFIKFSDR